MKKTGKLMAIFLSIILVCTMVALPASAHELVAGARWSHTKYINGVVACTISLNADGMTSPWSLQVDQAISNWNNYSSGKVKITKKSQGSSNCVLSTYKGSSWPYPDCVAFTVLYNYKGEYTTDPEVSAVINVGTYVSPSKFGNRIKSATTIFNNNYSKGVDTNRAKTITHEIGHCLNLGHTMSRSVMHQGWNLDWTNFDRPQAHDRSDLISYYNKIYK